MKLMMTASGVLYLASNSLTNPRNTSGEFSVLYNNPMNLSGKKVALVSATFTKGQANVLEEKITVDFKPSNEKRKGKMLKTNLATIASNTTPPLRSWADFFGRFPSNLTTPGKIRNKLVSLVTKFDASTNVAEITVSNHSQFECGVSYLRDMVGHSGWTTSHTTAHEQVLEGMSVILFGSAQPIAGNEMRLKIRPGGSVKVTLDVSRHAAYSFDLLRTEEFKTRTETLFQFKVWAYSARAPVIRSTVTVQPGPGHFDSLDLLLSKINEDPHFKSIGIFQYAAGKVSLKIYLTAAKTLRSINFGGLQHHFGFDDEILNFENSPPTRVLVAQRAPDMTRGTHNFFIYNSLVKNVPVNEQMVPLLSVLDATAGKYGQQIQHHVQAPVFVDCVDGPQQKVEITIADDSGNVKGLLQGKTMLTLAIKDA
jgi:hypothetical protein